LILLFLNGFPESENQDLFWVSRQGDNLLREPFHPCPTQE